jgi:hypothetical protein
MKTAPALALLALLTACAHDGGGFPSLAPRPIEKLSFAEPELPVVEAEPDPALDAQIGKLSGTLDSVAKGFAADAARAEAAGGRARGKPVGSDAWLDAQTALAQLDDWRAQTSSLLTEVDLVASNRAATLAPAYPALGGLRDRVSAEAERQGGTIDRLQSTLPAA